MVLGCVLFAVGRSNATLVGLHSVVVSKWFCEGDECVAKEFVGFCVVGAAAALFSRQGRATLAKSKQLFWEYDPTRGFAGQDILTQMFNNLPKRHHYQNVSPTVFLLLFVLVSFSSTNNFFVASCFLLASSLLLHSHLPLDNCVKECSSSRHVGLARLQLDTSLLCCCSFLLICSGTINFSVTSYFFLAPLLLLRSRLLLDNFTKDCPLSRQPGPAVKLLAAIFPCRCSLSLICPGANNFLSVSCSLLIWIPLCCCTRGFWLTIIPKFFTLSLDVDFMVSIFLVVMVLFHSRSQPPWYPETGTGELCD